MAWWDGLLQNLFQRDPIDGPQIGDELNPIGAFYAQQMQLGSQRLKRYKDFADMSGDTLISGALNIYADEVSQYDRVQGASIWPLAKNQKVQLLLKQMFDKVHVEDYLFGIARYLSCMGDNFVRPLFSSQGGGIVGMEFIDAEDVDRVVDKFNRMVGFRYGGGRKLLDPWAFIHFRMMSRTQSVKLGGGIYGTSMLEDARRTWRQLCLAAGTAVWTPAGFKPIEHLRAGDEVYCHDTARGETYETAVVAMSPMGKQPLVKVQTNHRELLVTPNHGLLALQADGTFTYKRADELLTSNGTGGAAHRKADQLVLPALQTGEQVHTVLVNPEPYYARLTAPAQYDAQGVMARLCACGLRTSLKNAHTFLQATGRGICYSDFVKLQQSFDLVDYEIVYGRSTRAAVCGKGFAFAADAQFARLFGFMLGDGWVDPDRQFVGFALGVNATRNQEYIALFERLFQCELRRTQEVRGVRGAAVQCGLRDVADLFLNAGFVTGFANKVIPEWVFGMSAAVQEEFVRGLLDADGSAITDGGSRITLANLPLVEALRTLCQQAGIPVSRSVERIERENRALAYRIWVGIEHRSTETVQYEAVCRVEPAGEGETYDIQVEDALHNFVADGVVSHNTLLEDALVIYRLELGGRHRVFYIDVGNAPYDRALRTVRQYRREFGKRQYYNPTTGEYTSRFNPLHLTSDIFWPVRQGSESRIDYMGTDPNISSIVDLDWFRNKLFGALRIPKAYIGGDEYSSTRVGLSQLDVNFARLIKRLQRALIVGFYRMGQLQLAVNGVDPLDQQNDFEICMSVISSLDQEQRLMAMDMSLQIAQKLRDMGLAMGIDDEVISQYVARHVLGLSPYDLRAVGQDPNQMPSPGQINSGDEVIDANEINDAIAALRKDPEVNRLIEQVRGWADADISRGAREEGAKVPKDPIDQTPLTDENAHNAGIEDPIETDEIEIDEKEEE